MLKQTKIIHILFLSLISYSNVFAMKDKNNIDLWQNNIVIILFLSIKFVTLKVVINLTLHFLFKYYCRAKNNLFILNQKNYSYETKFPYQELHSFLFYPFGGPRFFIYNFCKSIWSKYHRNCKRRYWRVNGGCERAN